MARTASKKVGLPRNHEDSQQEDFSRLSDRSARIFLRDGLDSILRYNVYISLRGEKMKKENISSMGSVAASVLAASCCIGPAIFVLFGASAGFMGKLSFFEPLRPYLLGVGFLMLGFSFWKLYVQKPDCSCEADVRTRKIARGIWWVGFGALVIAASFQQVLLWAYG